MSGSRDSSDALGSFIACGHKHCKACTTASAFSGEELHAPHEKKLCSDCGECLLDYVTRTGEYPITGISGIELVNEVGNTGVPSATADLQTGGSSATPCILTVSFVDIHVYDLPPHTLFTAQFSLCDWIGLSKPKPIGTNKEGTVQYNLSYSLKNNTAIQSYHYFFNKGSERNSSASGSATWKTRFYDVPPDESNKIKLQLSDGSGSYYEFLMGVEARGRKDKNSGKTKTQADRIELSFKTATTHHIPQTVPNLVSTPLPSTSSYPPMPSHSTTTTATLTTTTTTYPNHSLSSPLSSPHTLPPHQYRGGSDTFFASPPQTTFSNDLAFSNTTSGYAPNVQIANQNPSDQGFPHATSGYAQNVQITNQYPVPNVPSSSPNPNASARRLAKVQIGTKLYNIPADNYPLLCAGVCQKLKLDPASKCWFTYSDGITVEEEIDLQMYWSEAAGQVLITEGAHTPRTVCPPKKTARVKIGGRMYNSPASDFQSLYEFVCQKLQCNTATELRLAYGEDNFSIDDDADLQIFMENCPTLPIHTDFAQTPLPPATVPPPGLPPNVHSGLPYHSPNIPPSQNFLPPDVSTQNTAYYAPNHHSFHPASSALSSPAISLSSSTIPFSSPATSLSSPALNPLSPPHVTGQGAPINYQQPTHVFHSYSPTQSSHHPRENTGEEKDPKKGRKKNLEEDLAQQLSKLAIGSLVPLRIDLERFSEALTWKAVAPFGTIFRFGIFDKELAMSIPHLTVAQGSKIFLKMRAEMACHVRILLDSEPLYVTTMQKGSEEAVKIGKECPKEVTFVVKVVGEDDCGCSVPLTWIPREPKKSALLVGFSYDDFPEGAKLYGTENDARRLANILKHSFGFGKLTLLTGADATYAKLSEILGELTDTLDASNAENFVLYISGHGVKWHGETGDEALLASDVRFKYDKWEWKGQSHLITDGFWAPFLEKVAEKVPVTMIFDTCHSGKAYRLPEGRAKTVAVEYYLFEDPPPNVGWYPVSKDSKFAFLAAAAHQEKALEVFRDDGTHGSALIAAMEDVLFANSTDMANLSYRTFHSYLVDRIKHYKTQQMPLLEGAIDLGIFSSLTVTDPEFDSPIKVQLVKKSEKEATLSVQDPSRVIFNGTYHTIGKDNKLSALLQVDCASLHTARAVILEDFSLEEGDTAIYVKMPKVDIVSESDEANALHSALQVTSSLARITKKAGAENLRISLDSGNWVSTWCGSPFLPPCPIGNEAEFGQRIDAALRHISYLSLPLQISPHRNKGLKHIEVALYKKTPTGPLEIAKDGPNYGYPCFTLHEVENGKYIPNTGDSFGFEVKNTSQDKKKEIYVTVFLFMADGTRRVIYPQANPRAEKLEYDQPVKILSRPIPLIPSPSPPLPFFNTNHYWDVLVVYATSSFANYEHVVNITSITRGNVQRQDLVSMHNFIHQSRDSSDLRFTVIQKPFLLLPNPNSLSI